MLVDLLNVFALEVNSVDMLDKRSQLFGAELACIAGVLELGGVHRIRFDRDIRLYKQEIIL